MGYLDSGFMDASEVVNIIREYKGSVDDLIKCGIIEYGAGDGRISRFMTDYFHKVYHVDASYRMLQEAKEDIIPSNIIEYVLSSDNLFGISEPADYAYSMHVFIHNNYESGAQIMKSISDNLKPGGLALLQIPIYDVAREPESWTGVGVWTEQMLIDAAKESGFEILELNKNSGSFSYEQPGPNHFKYQIMRKTAE